MRPSWRAAPGRRTGRYELPNGCALWRVNGRSIVLGREEGHTLDEVAGGYIISFREGVRWVCVRRAPEVPEDLVEEIDAARYETFLLDTEAGALYGPCEGGADLGTDLGLGEWTDTVPAPEGARYERKGDAMKKWLPVLAMALALLSGCAWGAGENLLIRNDSSTPVGLVEIKGEGYGGGGCYADGSPIRPGDTFGFLMEPEEGGTVTLRVLDEERRTVLAKGTFRFDFSDGNTYRLSYASGRLSLA